MSSSANLANNVPALSTEPLTHVPPASSTEDSVPSPPLSAPPSTPDAGAAKSITEVPSVSITVAQTTDLLGGASAAVDSVPEPVPVEGPKSQPITGVQLPTESTPAEKTDDAMDLIDDQDDDDVEPMTSGKEPAKGIADAPIPPAGYRVPVFDVEEEEEAGASDPQGMC
jgi:hypothetical protein